MKAFLLMDSSGIYDQYNEFVSNVFLVPDNFEYKNDYSKFLEEMKTSRLFKLKKNGCFKDKDFTYLRELFMKNFASKYKEIKFINGF